MRALGKIAVLFLLGALPPAARAQARGNSVAAFDARLRQALANRESGTLRELLPCAAAEELTGLMKVPAQRLRVSLRALGPIGKGSLLFLQLEELAEDETRILLQVLCELSRAGDVPVAARRVPLAEAARSFRIAAHSSTLSIDAASGVTEMLDKVEIEVLRPTPSVFFYLDPAREVGSVSIAARGAEVFRAANFVALQRATSWTPGERVRVEVRSRLRPARKKKARLAPLPGPFSSPMVVRRSGDYRLQGKFRAQPVATRQRTSPEAAGKPPASGPHLGETLRARRAPDSISTEFPS